ncbi:HAD-IA family hydrolase [Streptomyces lycii]|uniref:HAD-IA family hydrolase n=1 Tax=Streptomyces lycii TaxID=2654337 RepID=A0ABQ7FLW0_9ACTN|nr:HAD-IA family hydrolase [Streptomyces lycii]KAF4408233.1 HAD-IA family hydrolase [Streptomyces lycii]
MTGPVYEAVLCDIDGVLRHWPPADLLERAHGLPAGCFAAAAFAPERLQPAVTGRVSDEEWRSGVADALALACGSADRARSAVAAWSAQVPSVDRDVVALLTRAREVAKVALVSNATTRLEADLAGQGLAGLAHVVVNTARIGVAKPDPRVYGTAADRVGAAPHRCLFVDDTGVNVAAAREAGMTAVHYRRPEDLRTALAPLVGDARSPVRGEACGGSSSPRDRSGPEPPANPR